MLEDVAYYKVLQFKQRLGFEILITTPRIHDPGEPTRHILYKVRIDLTAAQLALIYCQGCEQAGCELDPACLCASR